MTMIRTALAAALFAGSIAATPAIASGPPASRTVAYADLDLSRPRDVSRLRRRIASALETVCGSYATSESWAEREISRCRADAQARAAGELARLVNRSVQTADARSGGR
jgi:UrcA family protein